MMNNGNEKQITLIESTITPTHLSTKPPTSPTIKVHKPTIKSNKQQIITARPSITPTKPAIISTKSEITQTELIITSVKLAASPIESKITSIDSKMTSARPRINSVELKITSTRPRMMSIESIKTPIDEVLFIKDHIIRPNQPLFNVKNPKGWFNQFELKMLAADLHEDLTVYYDLQQELNNHDILCCILDVFQNMSMVNKYMYFKSYLLKKISGQERLLEIVSDLKLEDKYPSFLLNEMKQLTNDKLLEHNLKRLWLKKLPPQLRDILLLSSDSLSSLSLLADNMNDLLFLPEVKSSKEAVYQYENKHGPVNSDDHQVENSEAVNNNISIRTEKKRSCVNSFCKCI
ncbi:uncharacterized protein LOC114129966 [Aphis gossypii]|uniref:uncharacterized protein LOC114129966 n=1 Tax=Aphis gossypii TaxID=80765 RepID=UPI002159B5BE|nr:uncharacterized protein LOC114129966 [Aphis gossypii]